GPEEPLAWHTVNDDLWRVVMEVQARVGGLQRPDDVVGKLEFPRHLPHGVRADVHVVTHAHPRTSFSSHLTVALLPSPMRRFSARVAWAFARLRRHGYKPPAGSSRLW